MRPGSTNRTRTDGCFASWLEANGQLSVVQAQLISVDRIGTAEQLAKNSEIEVQAAESIPQVLSIFGNTVVQEVSLCVAFP